MGVMDLFRAELAELKAYRVPPEPPPVKLDANESPWPLPEEAREKLADTLRSIDLHRYPDGRAESLRRALAHKLGGDPDDYVLGSGSDELIALLATALAKPRPGATRPALLFPEPTFVMYGISHRAHGWQQVAVPLDERWDLDVDRMAEAIGSSRPNVVYYATPNNPTGNCFSKERLKTLIESFPDTLHVLDEAYAAFSTQSLGPWLERYEQCALLGTLSKVGLAGARVGWLRSRRAFAEELEKVRQPFNLNALSQEVARLALTELAPTFERQAQAIISERARLLEALGELDGLHCYGTDANFVLVQYSGEVPQLCAALLERGIAVRQFREQPRLSDCVRITVGTPEETRRLVQALGEILG